MIRAPVLILFVILISVGVTSAYAINITLGGTVFITEILNMMGNKITNVGAPTDPSDVATKQYVDSVPIADTLAQLGCTNNQLAQFDGVDWECVDKASNADTLDGIDSESFLTETEHDSLPDSDILAELNCSEDQIPKFVGSTWICSTDTDTNTDTLAGLGCSVNQFAQFDGNDWGCVDLVNPPGLAALGAQLFLVSPNGVNTKTTSVIMLVTNTGDVTLTNVSPVFGTGPNCDDMWFVSPSGGLEDFDPCNLVAPSPVTLGPGHSFLFNWDGTVVGDIDNQFTFCNQASGEDPNFAIVTSVLSCHAMTVIDPNDCGGCDTFANLSNYFRNMDDAQEDGEILCDQGDIALSALLEENSNINIMALKADDQLALSGDPVVGYRFSGVLVDGFGVSCLDLTP